MRSSQIHTGFRLPLPQYLVRLWVRHSGTWARGSWELRGAGFLGAAGSQHPGSLPLSDPGPNRVCLSTHHIFGIWLHGYGPIDFFPPPDSEVIFQVEDSLLPVGVGGIRG